MEGHTVYSPPPPAPAAPPPAARELTAEGLRAVGFGALVGIAVYWVPFLRFVFSYLNILAHEFGHALTSWIFGYPAVPAFDWRYGGGVTLSSDRSTALMVLCYLGLAMLLHHNRELPGPRNLVVLSIVAYSIAALTPVHRVLELGMGHAMELILAGVFLFRSLAGRAITHDIERPLYASCSVFMLLHNLSLSWGLMTSVDARAAYGMAKGGGHWMDLSRISIDYLGVGLPTVAFGLFVACWLTPVLSYLAYRWEPILTGTS